MALFNHKILKSGNLEIKEYGLHTIELLQENIEIVITGRFQASNDQDLRVELVIHHRRPRTLAKTSLRGTSRDKAKLSLVGKIAIDPDCPGSNSFLEERILLLSPTARGEVVPELEILTDDVKCSHAASLSTLDANQVFYLQSRGLGKKTAEQLLVGSFMLS